MNENYNPETGEIMEVPSTPVNRGDFGGGNTAGDLISQGQQLLQIRTRNQLMVAVQRPRDIRAFEKKLLAIAAEAGEDFFYSIPFKNRKEGTTSVVEGAGVGLARTAVSLWGNCSVETRIEQEVSDAFLVRSDFVDFENNYTRSETKRVSKLLPKFGGGTRTATGKELDLVYQQGASKVERDVILRSLPKHVIERAFEMAKAAALAEKAPVSQQIARIIRKAQEANVGLAQIEAYLGCPFTEPALKAADRDAREVCAHLRGLVTAIKSGDATMDEVFAATQKPTEAPASQAKGAVRASDFEPAQEEPERTPARVPEAPAREPAPPSRGNGGTTRPAPAARATVQTSPAPAADGDLW